MISISVQCRCSLFTASFLLSRFNILLQAFLYDKSLTCQYLPWLSRAHQQNPEPVDYLCPAWATFSLKGFQSCIFFHKCSLSHSRSGSELTQHQHWCCLATWGGINPTDLFFINLTSSSQLSGSEGNARSKGSRVWTQRQSGGIQCC